MLLLSSTTSTVSIAIAFESIGVGYLSHVGKESIQIFSLEAARRGGPR
jgi:hypothetical protein